MSTTDWAPAVAAAVQENRERPGALLPILHAVQHQLGHIPPDAVPVIASALNLSRAEVHGVVSFYHDFRDHAPGKHLVHICRAEACQSMGAGALVDYARQRLGVDFHGTTPNGAVTLEPIYCLGNCALSPAMMVDGEVYGRVTPKRFAAVMDGLEAKP